MKNVYRKLIPAVLLPTLSGTILLHNVIKEDFSKLHDVPGFSLNADLFLLVLIGMLFGIALTSLIWILRGENQRPAS